MIQLTPNVTILDNQVGNKFYSDLSLPIPTPTITNMVGDFTYNAEIVISGDFSAKYPHQLAYITGDINNLGETDPRILGLTSGEPVATSPYTYNSTNTASIVGSGASLRFQNVGQLVSGPPACAIYFPSLTKEAYVSYCFRPNIVDWDARLGGQMKMGRINADPNGHSNEPIYGSTSLHTQNSPTTPLDIYSHDQLYMSLHEQTSDANLYMETFMNQWSRYELWTKLPAHYALQEYQHGAWAGVTLPEQNQVYNCEPFLNAEMVLKPQAANSNYESEGVPKYWHKFMLPFYIRDWMDIEWWVDGVYVHTSPERVEFANGPVLHQAAKRFVQPVKQNSRTTNSITINCQTGNFNINENIYCFVINHDGKISDPFLFRAAQ